MAVFILGEVVLDTIPVPYAEVIVGESYLQVTAAYGGPDKRNGYLEVAWGVTDKLVSHTPGPATSASSASKDSPLLDKNSYWVGRIMLRSIQTLQFGWQHKVLNTTNNVFLKPPRSSATTIYKVLAVNGVTV